MRPSSLVPEPIRSILPFVFVAIGTAVLPVLDSDLARADIIRVPADQPTIQAGINAAAIGDEVLVAPGTYMGAENKNLDFHGKDIAVRSESGPKSTIIDCQGFGRGFILRSPLSIAAAVDGFTVENGNPFPSFDGGGVLIQNCSPTISNCVFRANTDENGYGGGIACYSSYSTIRNCSFENNRANSGGGGLYSRVSALALIDCAFVENGSRIAGGGARFEVPIIDNTATISQCTFHGNSSYVGGGLATSQRMLITDSIFTENFAVVSAGGLSASNASIERCTFSGNRAISAGALWVSMSTIADCRFHLNTADQLGGAVRTDGQSSLFQRCIFTENSAHMGGAVATEGSSTFENCTMVRNTAEVGSGVWVEGVASTLLNSIIAFGVNGEAFHCKSVGAVSCCDIFGNDGGDWVGCLKGELGNNGNISADPLFCDIEGGDLALCADSPCARPQSCGLIGALPEGCGPCGVTTVEPSTWGGIKHHARSLLFRPARR